LDFSYFSGILIILGAALVSALLVYRFQIPSLVAYLFAGAIIGPSAMNLISTPEHFGLLAEFGVVLLLFSLGLEFSLPKMIALRRSVFVFGFGQVAITMAIFGAAIYWWGGNAMSSVVLAGALALSSTAIVTKQLRQMKRVQSTAGKKAIGILLFQDIAAILFLILVPVLAGTGETGLWTTLAMAGVKAVILIVVLLGLGYFVIPRVYAEVSKSHSNEIFLLTTVVIVLLAAWLTHAFGLSMALGAFVIGMMLSESHFKHQIEADIAGFRDILLSLFFVTVGMNVDLSLLWEYGFRLILSVVALLLIKTIVITLLLRAFQVTKEASLQTGIYLAQAGEFGLALMTIAVSNSVIPNDEASFIILVLVMSMVVSPFMITHSAKWIARWFTPDIPAKYEGTENEAKVIIGGFGRVGRMMVELLKENNVPYVALDLNIMRVKEGREAGFNVQYGDAAKLSTLEQYNILDAKLLVLSFDDIDVAAESVECIRHIGCNAPVVIRTKEHSHQGVCIAHLGETDVIPELFESSLLIAEAVLHRVGIESNDRETQITTIRKKYEPKIEE